MADLSQSTVEAMEKVLRGHPELQAWEPKVLAEAMLKAALDEGGVVLRTDHDEQIRQRDSLWNAAQAFYNIAPSAFERGTSLHYRTAREALRLALQD